MTDSAAKIRFRGLFGGNASQCSLFCAHAHAQRWARRASKMKKTDRMRRARELAEQMGEAAREKAEEILSGAREGAEDLYEHAREGAEEAWDRGSDYVE